MGLAPEDTEVAWEPMNQQCYVFDKLHKLFWADIEDCLLEEERKPSIMPICSSFSCHMLDKRLYSEYTGGVGQIGLQGPSFMGEKEDGYDPEDRADTGNLSGGGKGAVPGRSGLGEDAHKRR